MSRNHVDSTEGKRLGASELIAWMTNATRRCDTQHDALTSDYVRADEDRLDDRVRAGVDRLMRAVVASVEAGLRGQAPRGPSVFDALAKAGVLDDPDFVGALIAKVRIGVLQACLPITAADPGERPSMLARLVESSDPRVALTAAALMAAESNARTVDDGHSLDEVGLPSALYQRLVWWVAAGLSWQTPSAEREWTQAARRMIEAHDGDKRVEMAAMRLAAAIDARADELPMMIDEALADRRLMLVAALIAHASGADLDMVTTALVDRDGGRLWLLLRALDMPRETVARIGYALAEAEPSRGIERFADEFDAMMAIEGEDARAAVAMLRQPAEYRAAMLALGDDGRGR